MFARLAILGFLFAFSGSPQMRPPVALRGASGDLDAQIAAAAKVLSARPEDSRAACRLAVAYLRKMRETVEFDYLERAARLVDDVLSRDPGYYEALRLRTEIAMERHEFALVAEYSAEMTRFAPNDPGAWGSLGDAAMELGDYGRAKNAYEKMVALKPALPSFSRIAWLRFITGDAPGAIALMQSATRSGGGNPQDLAWCLSDLGSLYWKTGNGIEAEASYRRALEILPTYYAAWAGLGRMASARNQVKEAIAAYTKAQANVPMPEYAAALEDLYTRAGNAKAAREQVALLQASEITLRATGEKANRTLALVYADAGRELERARELVENEIHARPDVYTWDAYSWVLFRQKELDKAWNAAQKALAVHTPEPAFHFHAGMIADAKGLNEDARRELQAALALNSQWDYVQAEQARATLAKR